jgi:hypothetical protein
MLALGFSELQALLGETAMFGTVVIRARWRAMF